jgi:hypothetical protein
MAAWTTQIRGDFLAIAFSLSSLYVALVSNGRWPFIVAALLAGLAILVKQTYVAAPLAIFVWLVLYKRRFGSAVLWSLVVLLTVVAGYAVAWWREPLVLRHLAALSSPIFEYRGALSVLRTALSQTLVPFAVVGAFLALRRGNAGTALLATFVIASWLVAVGTVLQIGGSINYFFEPLMASAILAGRGLVEVARAANQAPLAARAWLVVLLVWACSPIIVQDVAYLRQAYRTALSYEGRKARWSSFADVVTGHRLLSTVPSVTALGRSPEVPDPYLNTALELRGKWSSAPVVADLEAARYDLVCLYEGQADEATGFRGADAWSDDILTAFRKGYEFACVFDDMEIWLPRQSVGALRSRLAGAGCEGRL